jgi:DNA-binding NtrC family response regulator
MMKVLVVDDEQLVRWFLERALKKWGHDVISVSNARDAISQIDSTRFDIIFTDLRMPEGNGSNLLKKIEDSPNVPQHIVVCSAFITAEMAQEFRKKGFLALKKPFKLAELESTMRQCR